MGQWLGLLEATWIVPKADKIMQPVFNNLADKGLIFHALQARSSVGERFLDTEEVGSSILPVPTIS